MRTASSKSPTVCPGGCDNVVLGRRGGTSRICFQPGGWGGGGAFHAAAPLTAAEMSVYGSAAQPDKPADGLLSLAGPGEPIPRRGRKATVGGGGRGFKEQLTTFEPVQYGASASERRAVIVLEHSPFSLYLLTGKASASVAAVTPSNPRARKHCTEGT